MTDRVRIYWTTRLTVRGTLYEAHGNIVTDDESSGGHFTNTSTLMFEDYDREKFFARYNALTVTKEPAPNPTNPSRTSATATATVCDGPVMVINITAMGGEGFTTDEADTHQHITRLTEAHRGLSGHCGE